MELQTILDLLAEFNGRNHAELAKKYRFTVRTVYTLIRGAAQASASQHLSSNEESPIGILWAGTISQLDTLQGSLAVLQAAQTLLNGDYPDHVQVLLSVLHSSGQANIQGSSSVALSADQAESQSCTQDHKSDLPAAEALQPIPSGLPCATSMSPFTVFLGRLVEHLGAEIAINLVREFAGKTIQFPITQDYTGNDFGFPALAPVVGTEFKAQVDQVLKHATRANGKQLLTREEAGYIVSNSTAAIIGPSHLEAEKSQHTPLSIDEAIEISQRLLATVRQCSAATQLTPLPDAETLVKDESCTAHPDQCTTLQCKPAFVQPSSEQALHKPPA